MQQFTEGDRVRIDIPDESDPDHEVYHSKHGSVRNVVVDDADEITGDRLDAVTYRVELDDGSCADFRHHDLRSPIE
jgi:ribosomal protein L21E